VSYDTFHSAFTCIQSDLPEQNAFCLLAGRENYETSATAENAVTTCEGDKPAKIAEPAKIAKLAEISDLAIETTNEPADFADIGIEITKQADFGAVVKQAQEMQAAVLTAMQHELLSWHYHLGHLPFNQLLNLAQEGRIPKHLANCQVLKCPACLFGKMTRKPWRTKGNDKRSICKDSENYPEGNTSVNQMESMTPGLIPQSTGKLLQAKYNGMMIFVDHHTRFTYIHLMTSLNSEQMMVVKEMYEQIAQTYGVSVHGY